MQLIFFILDAHAMSIKIYSDQTDAKYYVGEDVTINVSIAIPSSILCVSWQKETENASLTIDTTLAKYIGSKDEIDKCQLMIKDCDESDEGTYYLLAACSADEVIYSNKVQVRVVEGNVFYIPHIEYLTPEY